MTKLIKNAIWRFLVHYSVSRNRSVRTSVKVGVTICAPLPSGDLREVQSTTPWKLWGEIKLLFSNVR